MLVKLPCGCILNSLFKADDPHREDYWLENMPPDTYREDACGCRRCMKCGSCVGLNLGSGSGSLIGNLGEPPNHVLDVEVGGIGGEVTFDPTAFPLPLSGLPLGQTRDEYERLGPIMTDAELAALKGDNERNRKKAFRYEQALQDVRREMQFNSRSKTIKRKVLRVISKALGEVK